MIRPDLTDFRDAMSEALKALKDNGTLKQLNEKWFKDDYFTKYANLVNYKLN
jgi:ABC-type amino acid transport substrate-binding protein